MPRSHGVLKVEVWEAASEFRRLPLAGQWAYAMLISQPQINNLGVLPYVPEKWWRFAYGLDRSGLDQLLDLLEQRRYTITDVETGELLVRTFIRHDGVWKVPKLVTNARRLWRETESPRIRGYLADRHPWLLDDRWNKEKIEKHEVAARPPETPLDTPTDTGTDTPSVTPTAERGSDTPNRTGIPTRARARDGLPQGLPQPQGQGRNEGPTQQQHAANGAAAAETSDRLRALGLDAGELLTYHPADHIDAWLDLAATEAHTNPAAFVLTGLNSGQVPSPRRSSPDAGKTRARDEPDYEAKALELFERTHDREQVADWLAGLTRLSPPERDRILVAVVGVSDTVDDEPDLG
jgi:hypothetical protein